MSIFSIKGGTRLPSPREVGTGLKPAPTNPAVGRVAPSGLLSCFPLIIEVEPT